MIAYRTGDALEVDPTILRTVIAHVCNNRGGWGAGFTGAISRKWRWVEDAYRRMGSRKLGSVQWVAVDVHISVVNMIAQEGYSQPRKPAIRYGALHECLSKLGGSLRASAIKNSCRIQMPRIGCGLAGGEWSKIEPMLEEHLEDFDVHVYDLPGAP